MLKSFAVTALAVTVLAVAGCGGGNHDTSTLDQAAVQQQIDAARTQGAKEAHLEDRVKQLERETRDRERNKTKTVTKVVVTRASPTANSSGSTSAASSRSGYMVQLGSFTSESEAQQHASQLREMGLSPSILWSNDYVQLRPGFWVTYDGFYSTMSAAQAAAARARTAGVSDAFARFVTST